MPLDAVTRFLRRLRPDTAGDRPDDRELLDRFARGDEAAFAEIVRRHGGAVFAVCRALTQHEQDAEDAFQAAFLVLAKKAGQGGWQPCVGGWLAGVARHVALKLLRSEGRRAGREAAHTLGPRSEEMTDDPADAAERREADEALLDEVGRLPECYRGPIVLCYLEGHSHAEAARMLGRPLGTVKSQIERGCALLRDRLARRGLGTPASHPSAGLTRLGSAVPPAAAGLAGLATQFAHGLAPAARAVALAESFLRGMAASFWARSLVAVAALAVFGAGAWLTASPAGRPPAEAVAVVAPAPPAQPAEEPPRVLRHKAAVLRVAVSPDGKRLAAGCADGSVTVWELGTGKAGRTFRTAGGGCYAVGWTAKGELAACGALGFTTWGPDGGKELARVPSGTAVKSAALSADGETTVMVPVHRHGGVQDVAAGEGKAEGLTAPDERAAAPALSRDGKTAALLGSNPDPDTVLLIDPKTGKSRLKIRPGHGRVAALALSPDGKFLATCGQGSTVKVWDAARGELVRALEAPSPGVAALAFSPNGGLLAAGCGADVARPVPGTSGPGPVIEQKPGKPLIQVWEVGTGKQVARLSGHGGEVASLAFSPDGRWIASGGADRTARTVMIRVRGGAGRP